jgi:predicted Rossmann fold nucleotide-binding protein DprA/Smf involved in DNA uptake
VDRSGSLISKTSIPGIEWLVPQKRGIEREVLGLPLTRRQRFIYFLVDGRRTVADLARCTGKNIQEIELILSELQEQGLVAV